MKRCTCCGRIYVSERDFLRGTSRWRKCARGHLYFNCACNSTLMLVAGKHDWYTPDMFMSRDAASIFNELTQMRELPLLPEAAMQIQMLLAEPNSSLDDLVKAVRSDPLFSMNILTAANAARMPGSQPIKSLKEAIASVGRSRLAELSYPAAMVSFEFRTTKYEKARYWSEAFTTGMVAESLARLYLPKESAEMAYFAGIFANVGWSGPSWCRNRSTPCMRPRPCSWNQKTGQKLRKVKRFMTIMFSVRSQLPFGAFHMR